MALQVLEYVDSEHMDVYNEPEDEWYDLPLHYKSEDENSELDYANPRGFYCDYARDVGEDEVNLHLQAEDVHERDYLLEVAERDQQCAMAFAVPTDIPVPCVTTLLIEMQGLVGL